MTTTTTRKLTLSSIPMVHSPGVIRFILESVAPFDEPKAVEILEAMGLLWEDACRVAAKAPGIEIVYDDEAGTVVFTMD